MAVSTHGTEPTLMSRRAGHVGTGGGGRSKLNLAVAVPSPARPEALTFTVPKPAGTTTWADVGDVATTRAGVVPKATVAPLSPIPVMVTVAPGRAWAGTI